jgi:voltage-gated potassium channel
MLTIGASIGVVLLDGMPEVHARYGRVLLAAEWLFTILFTVEHALRLAAVASPRRYALTFYGVVDLVSIVPTYLSLVLAGTQALLVIRALRILRIFRVLKLGEYLEEAGYLRHALRGRAGGRSSSSSRPS